MCRSSNWRASDQPFGAPLTGHTDAVASVAFSPDGRRIVSGSSDATVRRWPADASPDMLCAKLTTNMSRKQWHDLLSPDMDYKTLCPRLPIAADG
jgi:WD40 repeat protein